MITLVANPETTPGKNVNEKLLIICNAKMLIKDPIDIFKTVEKMKISTKEDRLNPRLKCTAVSKGVILYFQTKRPFIATVTSIIGIRVGGEYLLIK